MARTIAVLGLILASGWGATAADDDAAKAAKKLEGTYTVIKATTGGQPDPKGDDVKAFLIKDGKITIQMKQGKEMNAKFTLDPSKKPAEIDLMPEDAGGSETLKAIYRTKETDKGLELILAFPKRESGARPKDFDGKSTDEVAVQLLRMKE